ncbi:Ferredoxin subunit of nitrite reductase or a ring-hydroxylating dioxygenase [Mycolicibacterium neoaurum]|uniref:Cytochrome bc1 complex Rieske iron-sulfur subunit n=2 Tax=Mycobacteriaceae TaxID=1762 RepID=A0AAV2WHK3_MYCNE|nr:Rieske (2Fe-2S) domain-containing protein [Mycolicibacterium neoaurum]SDF07124.1 Ferredoxin subunit of nitrite reductase or a ring-hydroxylating dioxygenase [Mycolicibacterium neoaurum]
MSAMTLGRRQMLVGSTMAVGALGAAAACGSGDTPSAAPQAPSESAENTELAKTADVPVGSALVVDDVVLTQAQPGQIRGFSTVCPHAGCAVSKVTGAELICPCHGSSFGLDGAVITGPARGPLTPVDVVVRGDSVVRG